MPVPTEVQAERDEEARIDERRCAWERMNVKDCTKCYHGWFVVTERGGSNGYGSDEPEWYDGYCSCKERTEEGIEDDGNCLCDTL